MLNSPPFYAACGWRPVTPLISLLPLLRKYTGDRDHGRRSLRADCRCSQSGRKGARLDSSCGRPARSDTTCCAAKIQSSNRSGDSSSTPEENGPTAASEDARCLDTAAIPNLEELLDKYTSSAQDLDTLMATSEFVSVCGCVL